MFDLKKFLILTLIGFFIFILSSTVLANEENKIFLVSLKIQKIINDFFINLRGSFLKNNDEYREKYFYLLQEVSQLKLNLKKIEEKNKSLEELTNIIPLEIYKKDPQGLFYASFRDDVNEGDIVIDRNFVLIGFIFQKTKNYLIIKTLLHPDIVFNLSDSENKFLGSGRTLVNGFVEINDAKNYKIRKDMLVFTYGGDSIFKPNFLVGTISDLEQVNVNSFRIIVKLSGLFEDNKFFVYK